MNAVGQTSRSTTGGGLLIRLFWYLVAVAICLSVFVLNRGPLIYFDTFAYLNRGLFLIEIAKDLLGLDGSVDLEDVSQTTLPDPTADTEGTTQRLLDGSPVNEGRTISASRSRTYSFIIGYFASVRLIGLTAVMGAILVVAAIWLPIRVAVRQYGAIFDVAPTIAISLGISALGSLPFFVAYLMPDIFAPILILTVGSLAVFSREMNRWEILASVLLGCFAVTTHLTHLAIATALVPVAALVSVLLAKDRWWLAPGMVVIMSIFGIAEQTTYRVAVAAKTDFEAVFQPFVTARLIQDQVGYEYLQRHCPDATIVTCELYDALGRSDDPMRLTASHIMFQKTDELGSFLLMNESSRKAVAQAQFQFFFDVFFDAPVDTTLAMLRNTIDQVRLNRVDQTLSSAGSITAIRGAEHLDLAGLGSGRLTDDLSWLKPVMGLHNIVYLVSLLVIAPLLIWPGVLPKGIKAFVLVIALGILANAFFCGAISQPAARYGGRVIWLLPFSAAICVLFAPILANRLQRRRN